MEGNARTRFTPKQRAEVELPFLHPVGMPTRYQGQMCNCWMKRGAQHVKEGTQMGGT